MIFLKLINSLKLIDITFISANSNLKVREANYGFAKKSIACQYQ